MGRPLIQIVIASTRPGRVGRPIAEWVFARLQARNDIDVELIDLAEVGLPFLDEPHQPRLRQYVHQHTKDWSATIDRGDAFVFVTPEYNYGFNAPLKNAIDYLHHEWKYKAVGLVSYGGVAAGTRAAQMLKLVLTALKMVPISEAVHIPFVKQFMNDENLLQPNNVMEAALTAMVDELLRWTSRLVALRGDPAARL